MADGKRSIRAGRRLRPWGVVAALAVGCAAVFLLTRAPSPAPPPSPAGSAAPTSAPAPTSVPTPTPAPASDPAEVWLEQTLAGMPLRDKLCQMMVVSPAAITGVSPVQAAGGATRSALEKYPVGGLIYDRSNLRSKEQVREMLTDTQRYAKLPLLLTCDEEGGRVNRLMATVGTTRLGPMLDYQDRGPDTARDNARTIAEDMSALGFNLDLAPVADVWSNPQNTVIGDRAYSTDFSTAARLIPAAVEGFHAGGVATALKHFPGHGDTAADTHNGPAYVSKDLDRLRQEELLPFQAGIDAGSDAVMVAHITLPSVSDEPALFSYELVTALLREEMGFQGVVITDSLEMAAVSQGYAPGQIAVKAVCAGVDMLLCPPDLDAALDALTQAVQDGTVPPGRIDDSVRRILRLKLDRGILQPDIP